MNLLEFYQTFPDESACEQYLIAKRWPEGFVCVHCNHHGGWYLKARRTFECTACHKQQSITAQTVFQQSKIPLQEWFLAMPLMATNKKGLSGLQLQRDLPKHDMNTIYLLQNKLRHAMAARGDLYQLGGLVEADDAFLGAYCPTANEAEAVKTKPKCWWP